MGDSTGGSFEYPDEAGYPDGTGTLTESQRQLVAEVRAADRVQPGINFFVVDNEDAHRFEAVSGDTLVGQITYRRTGDVVTLVHTSVFPEFQGQGVATALVRQVLDSLRSDGLKVGVECPVVKTFVETHPEYEELVAAD